MLINVIDAPMGFGKTSAAITYMNYIIKNDSCTRFLYITPYLDEVKRIKTNCAGFKEPQSYGTKMKGIEYLFDRGINIVSTHSLFSRFNERIIDLSKMYGYVLIMDEVADVVEPLEISSKDKAMILREYTRVDPDTNMLIWTDRDYTGKLEEYKNLCDMGCVTVYGTGNEQILLLWMFPVSVFRAFKEVYILTYFFNSQIQKYYYDLYGCDYNYLFVKKHNDVYYFTDESVDYDTSEYKRNIHLVTDESANTKINQIGEDYYALSKSWYVKYSNSAILQQLKNNCVNFFQQITKTPSSKNLWTTFKDFEPVIRGKGYTKGFVAINLRATNEYRHKTAVAYLVNTFLNPVVKNFFLDRKIEINEDEYALSEMLQLIFRSAIRDNKPIKLYVPSKRMRELLMGWLNN